MTTIESVQQAHRSLIEQAGAVAITSDDENERAARLLSEVLRAIKDIEGARLAITRGLDASKAAAIEQERAATKPYKEVEQHLRGLILEYTLEQQRLLNEERAAIEAEASRAAEEGRQSDADSAMDSLVFVPQKPTRAAGTSVQVRWHGEVTDFPSLVLAVASGEAPIGLIEVNQSALDALARATRGPSTIKGIAFRSETGLAASARR